ncbi:MAG: hypothetical protein LBU46_01580 [Candidatus Accumulibacter sp.]|jgi:hypothetical protein|nr:hypothetical protein [Accumulibacter sp.]
MNEIAAPLEIEKIVIHNAEITSVHLDRPDNAIGLHIRRHPHWMESSDIDGYSHAPMLCLCLFGIFDFDCGSAVIGSTIDALEQELDVEASTDFPVWRWRFVLQEGQIDIRATSVQVNSRCKMAENAPNLCPVAQDIAATTRLDRYIEEMLK